VAGYKIYWHIGVSLLLAYSSEINTLQS
jgi:hypothetical protein